MANLLLFNIFYIYIVNIFILHVIKSGLSDLILLINFLHKCFILTNLANIPGIELACISDRIVDI